MSEPPDDEETFAVRLGAGPVLVLMRIEVAHSKRVLIVPASLRPDLAQTTVAARRAEALNLSRGQGVMLQLARTTEGDGDPWGPIRLVSLEVDDRLDPDAGEHPVSMLLGRDFLQAVWVTYVGATMVMISWPSPLTT